MRNRPTNGVYRIRKRSVVRQSRERAIPRSRELAGQSVAAAEFKTTCLELMDRVRETGVEYVITKHNVPVAKLVPYIGPENKELFGAMKGSVLKYDRPFEPVDGEWDVNRA